MKETIDYSNKSNWYKIPEITKEYDTFYIYSTVYFGANEGDPDYATLDNAEMLDVLVDPQCRGGGVGNTLLQTAIDWLRAKGIQNIFLESGKDNHNAHRFFEKRGFVHVSEIYKLNN